jgi:hypothetical protein
MAGIKIKKFGGLRPILHSDSLEKHLSVHCENCDLSRGSIASFREPLLINNKTGNFLFKNDCVTITSANKCASVVDTKINCGYLISTGLFEYPKIGKVMAVGAVDWIRLGFPCDLPAPTAAGGSPSAASEVIVKTQLRSYAYRLKNKFGFYSGLSDASNVLTLDAQNHITLTLPTSFDASYTISDIEIFTSETTSDISGDNYLADWFSIGTVAFGASTFIDEYLDLGALITTEDYEPVPPNLSCVQYWRAGVIAGISDNMICFSEKNKLDSFPANFRYTVHDKPVCIVASNTALFVATDGRPAIIYHDSDCAKKSLHTVKDIITIDYHAIVSIKSAVHHNEHAIWATKDGLLMIAANGQTKLLTAEYYTPSQWRELNPATMVGAVHDGVYYGFTDKIGIRFHLPDNTYAQNPDANLTTLSFKQGVPKALYRADNDELYILFDDGVYKWAGSDKFMTATWHSATFDMPSISSMTAYKLKNNHSSVDVTHYCDDYMVDNATVSTNNTQRLPVHSGFDWSVRLKTTGEVTEYHLSTSVRDLGMN